MEKNKIIITDTHPAMTNDDHVVENIMIVGIVHDIDFVKIRMIL